MAGILSLLIVACATPSSNQDSDSNAASDRPAVKGSRAFGGNLLLAHYDDFVTIYPPRVLDLMSSNVAAQVFEGLVQFDARNLSIRPRIAESWTVSDDGLIYTFKIRKGVRFHDDDCFEGGIGRELSAHDVAWSMTLLCTPGPDNLVFAYTLQDRIKGATAFYQAAASGKPMKAVEGIRVVDDSTIEFTLEQPSHSFLYTLAQAGLSILPKEGVAKYSNQLRIGTGPFLLPADGISDKGMLTLVRNPKYYGVDTLGNSLPYLDSVQIRSISTKRQELADFQAGRLHVVNGLPSQSVLSLVEENLDAFQGDSVRWVLDPSPEMSTDYYQFNMGRPIFKDVRVREAISYAIDRTKIIDEVLNGEAYAPGIHGISPPSFAGYSIAQLEGFSFDPDKAKALLAAAGYPGGEGFPALTLEVNKGTQNAQVAFEIQAQLLSVLGINIELEVTGMADKINHDRYGLADISRKSWIADFPSPESFLHLFYGINVPESVDEPSFPNTARYQNDAFDALFRQAIEARDAKESYDLFMQAEQEMLRDVPLVVLWYNEAHKLKHASVWNFYSNPMNYWDLGRVYMQPLSAAAVH